MGAAREALMVCPAAIVPSVIYIRLHGKHLRAADMLRPLLTHVFVCRRALCSVMSVPACLDLNFESEHE